VQPLPGGRRNAQRAAPTENAESAIGEVNVDDLVDNRFKLDERGFF